MDVTHSFGYWVRRQRKALDLTQKALARRAACSGAMIRKIEADERKPSTELAEQLAEALAVPAGRREAFVAAARGLAPVADLPLPDKPLPAAATRAQPADQLPSPVTPFLGRQEELALLNEQLAAEDTRLLTLTGAGGAGKTRLALQAAQRAQSQFPGGVTFVPLAGVDDPQHLVTAIAGALDLVFSGTSSPREQLVRHLYGRRMLLLLDNVEQLLPDGARILAALIQGAPDHTLLVTSRERLKLQTEVVLPVAGVPLQTARTLFVERARRADATLDLSTAQAQATIADICRLVEGLPLAVELAATWIRLLPLDEILADLRAGIDLLAGDMHDLPERHHSMQAVFNASWELLSSEQQQLLARLSVFSGGFSRQAAEEICGATTAQLADLLDRSLIQKDGSRFSLHTLLRQFAAGRLQTMAGEQAAVRQRHATFYLALLRRVSDRLMFGHPPLKAWQSRLDRDVDNIHAAWEWAVTHDRPRLLRSGALAFYHYLDLRGQVLEGMRLFKRFEESVARVRAAQDKDAPLLRRAEAMALAVQAGFGVRTGDPDARQQAQRALALLDGLHAPYERAPALNFQGILSLIQGDLRAARASAEEALSLGQHEDHPWSEALARNLLGLVHLAQKQPHRARDTLRAALAVWDEQLDLTYGKMRATIILGLAHHALGQPETAEEIQMEALSLARDVRDRSFITMAFSNLAFHRYALGQLEQAAAGFRAAVAEARRFNLNHSIMHGLLGLGLTAAAQGQAQRAATILSFGLAKPGPAETLLLGEPSRVLSELRAELPPAQVTAAEERAAEMDLADILACL